MKLTNYSWNLMTISMIILSLDSKSKICRIVVGMKIIQSVKDWNNGNTWHNLGAPYCGWTWLLYTNPAIYLNIKSFNLIRVVCALLLLQSCLPHIIYLVDSLHRYQLLIRRQIWITPPFNTYKWVGMVYHHPTDILLYTYLGVSSTHIHSKRYPNIDSSYKTGDSQKSFLLVLKISRSQS